MTRGKIVLVPFPFDDLATQKARPAVCLTEPVTTHRHIVLAFVTSRQPDEPLDTDVGLDPEESRLRPNGPPRSVNDQDPSAADSLFQHHQAGAG
jgi:mRNA interferase MazF